MECHTQRVKGLVVIQNSFPLPHVGRHSAGLGAHRPAAFLRPTFLSLAHGAAGACAVSVGTFPAAVNGVIVYLSLQTQLRLLLRELGASETAATCHCLKSRTSRCSVLQFGLEFSTEVSALLCSPEPLLAGATRHSMITFASSQQVRLLFKAPSPRVTWYSHPWGMARCVYEFPPGKCISLLNRHTFFWTSCWIFVFSNFQWKAFSQLANLIYIKTTQ